MKKDILFICQHFHPEYISSATLPFDTAKKLVEGGYSVDVITGYPKDYLKGSKRIKRKEIVDNIKIKRIRYYSFNKKKKIGRLINFFSFTLMTMFRMFSFRKYKYIFVYSNPPILPKVAYRANRLFKTKIVYILYDIYPEIALKTNSIKENGVIHKYMNSLNRKLYPRLSRLVVLSDDMKDYIIKNRGIEVNKVVVIPNWYKKIEYCKEKNPIKNDKFKKIENDKRFKISYTGNLGTAQDSDVIIALIKRFKNNDSVCFIISGHGNKMGELKTLLINDDFHNLYIFDFLHDNEYEKLLALSDAFLLSLKKDLAGLASPSKMYSYLSAGKPIIGLLDSKSKLAKLIIKENIGMISNPNDEGLLDKTINGILIKDERYYEMCSNALHLFQERYETKNATQKYIEMMRILEKQK